MDGAALRAALLPLAVALAGCGGDGVTPDPGLGMLPPQPTRATTLTELQAAIFTPRCALPACHAGGFPAAGLRLEDGATFGSTVGVASAEIPTFQRVEPFDVADSYLFMKVDADPRIAFSPMPLVGNALTPAELADLREWIEAGAKDN